MLKTFCRSLLFVLLGCDTPTPQWGSTCIHGDPSGPPRCQAETYQYAR